MEAKKLLKTAVCAVLGALALWAGAVWLLPLVLPFLPALLLALLTAPAAERLSARCGLPRRAAGPVCVAAAELLCGTALFLLGRTLARQAQELLTGLPGLLRELELRLEVLADRLPGSLSERVSGAVAEFFRSGAGFAEQLPARALKLASDAVKVLPETALTAVTALAAGFLFSARLPELRQRLSRRLPEPLRRRAAAVLRRVKTALGGWFRAQLRLIGLTFGILTPGLLLLRVRSALLPGLLISLMDALPVLGVGTALLPWAAVLALRGETVRAAAMTALWLLTLLVRTAAEPRLIGRQMGLDPLLTLAALYAGFRLCGVAGMLLFPLGAAVLRQFFPPQDGKLPA